MTLHTSDITALLRRIEEVRPGFDSDRVMRAFTLTRDLYKGEPHWTGMSVTEHVMGVLDLLLPFEPDEDAIAASILHHAFQIGHGITLIELEKQFGPAVRSMISGVHLLSNVTMQSRRHSIDDLRLMLISVSDDIRVILITLCDRCHVLDQLQDRPHEEEAKRIANDVLHLFAPVAARLGIYRLKHMLEQRAFPISYPSDAEKITEQLAAVEAKKGHFLERSTALLHKQLMRQGIEVEAESREKEPYSIFRKMRSKSLSHVEDVQDLFAVRLITGTPEECYRVLGFLHTMGRPVTNRFKDYIAFPKPNGYQSLHTTLLQLPGVPKDTFVEVQIRSAQMHREAKYGIAAHWSYKEFGAARRAVEQAQLHAMLSSQEPVGGPVGGQSLADNIFVLTPKGDVVELPEGATPLDFAFQVHTDLGLSFRAARVNGSVVSLDHELENGDVVEVQKYATPRPSPQWLQLVKMASSRSKLKRHLYAQRREELVTQ
ncbi:MAG: HD domain-containing protein, partial [Candidatus Peribacteraceae bacterium]|nr:HD domain-containing protein [Candidatus Peribacteraceae bacterium]